MVIDTEIEYKYRNFVSLYYREPTVILMSELTLIALGIEVKHRGGANLQGQISRFRGIEILKTDDLKPNEIRLY